MAPDNKLELVIEVQADKANAQIKGVNQSLAGIERIAVSVARNASTGIDGMTASMVKGSLAGNLLAEAIKGAASWTKDWITAAAQMAAHEEKIRGGMLLLAKARGIDAEAAAEQAEAIREIGRRCHAARRRHAGDDGVVRRGGRRAVRSGHDDRWRRADRCQVRWPNRRRHRLRCRPDPVVLEGRHEKAREKIRATYGVDVKDKAVLQQIVDTAKQPFGGNIDMAIRSAAVQDTIQLYAMATGQTIKGMPGKVAPVTLGQAGASLYQMPGHSNGSPLPSGGGLLPSIGFDRIGAGLASNAGPLVIQLDGPATTSLLNGVAVKAVASNPRTVQAATLAATKANAGRRAMTALQISPGTITA